MFLLLRASTIFLQLQWGHALSGMDTSRLAQYASKRWTCFNGAMPFQAWIRGRKAPSVRGIHQLQWGHALSGMDTPTLKIGARIRDVCFNGAMPFQAWILGQGEVESNPVAELQWGHALSGMDTRLYLVTPARLVKLQWGHALSGMDTTSRSPCQTSHQSFNGAMPFQAWILASCRAIRASSNRLQWGHALSGMDTPHG